MKTSSSARSAGTGSRRIGGVRDAYIVMDIGPYHNHCGGCVSDKYHFMGNNRHFTDSGRICYKKQGE